MQWPDDHVGNVAMLIILFLLPEWISFKFAPNYDRINYKH